MSSFSGAAKPAGDKKIVASFAASAQHASVFLHKSNHANGNDNWTSCAARFSADDANFEPLCGTTQTAIKFFNPSDLGLLRGDERYERELRHR